MIRTFKSRVDKTYHTLMWFVIIMMFYLFWQQHIAAAVTTLIILIFLLESLFNTEYIISTDGYLRAKSGFYPKYDLRIADIQEIRYIRSCSFAYALSCDRIQIKTPYYTRSISPDNTEVFIKELKRKNPGIVVLGS